MERRTLGNTGITTTVLGLGTLTMSPVQRNLSVEEGADVILAALNAGIRLIDTAQMYGSYPQVRRALQQWKGDPITLITKTPARTPDQMKAAIDQAFTELGVERLDGFLLHALKSPEDFRQRLPALEVLQEVRAQRRIRAIGASSHFCRTISYLAGRKEMELLHPIINREGFGVLDLPMEEHYANLRAAARAGKGLYAMKPLGGGHLRLSAASALQWLLPRPEVQCFVVGMTSADEVRANVAICNGEEVGLDLLARLTQQERRTFVNTVICNGCGTCQQTCDHQAIQVVEGKAVVNPAACILCGYCAPRCPMFAIRVI